MKARLWKLARWPLGALLVLYALYLGGMNWALRSGWLADQVNRAQPDAVLHLDGGYSYFPGRITVTGLALRFQDPNLEMQIRAPRLSARLGVLGLLRKRLELTHVRGEAVSYRQRMKVTREPGDERRLAALPPIEGYAAIPLRVPVPPSTTPTEDLWTIHVEVDEATVAELWMVELRYVGSGRVSGAFELAPRRHLWVRDGSLTLEDGTLHVGPDAALLRPISAKIHAEYPTRNPDPYSTVDNVLHLRWGVEVSGAVLGLSPLSVYAPSTRLKGGAGELRAKLRLVDGALLAGAHLGYQTDALGIATNDWDLSVDGECRLDVDDSQAHLAVRLERARWGARGWGAQGLRARALVAQVSAGPPHLKTTPTLQRLSLEAPELSLGPGELPLGGGLRLGGTGSLKLAGEPSARGRLHASVLANLDEVRFTAGQHRLSAAATFKGELATWTSWSAGGTLKDGALELRGVRTTSGERRGTGWWLRAALGDMDYVGVPPRAFSTVVKLRAKDLRPVIDALRAEGAVPGVVQTVVGDEELEVASKLERRSDGAVELQLYHAKSGSFLGQGRLRLMEGRRDGVFHVSYGPLGVGLELGPDGLDVSPLAGADWYRRHLTARFPAQR